MARNVEADKALISDLGGVAELARKLKCSQQVVSNWNTRGIPARVKLEHPELFLPELAKRKTAKVLSDGQQNSLQGGV